MEINQQQFQPDGQGDYNNEIPDFTNWLSPIGDVQPTYNTNGNQTTHITSTYGRDQELTDNPLDRISDEIFGERIQDNINHTDVSIPTGYRHQTIPTINEVYTWPTPT